ncbi:MAG TPA: tetratricopeptide repeat protein [Blastocatellia bacterium]|nr:tetratricopeptide repeat protein [Blastocatellia bacterium]
MNAYKTIRSLSAAIAAVLLAAVAAFGSSDKANGKRFSYTTRSDEARKLVARIVQGIESFEGAQQLLPLAQKMVELDPEFTFGHYYLATFTPPPDNQAHAAKATELAQKASDAERRYIEGVFATRAQQHDKAIEIFLDLARQYPEERMVHMMIGQVYNVQGKADEAKAAFERAAQLDSSTARVHSFLGNIHLLRGEYAKARDLFKKSLAKKAEGTAPFIAHYGLAFAYVYEGDMKSALNQLTAYKDEYVRTGAAANFPPVFIWNSIGRLLLESGRAEESIEAYEKGYADVPQSSMPEDQKKIWLGRLHHGRGRALAKMGKHEEAWKEAELIKKMIDEGGEQGKQFMPAYHYIAGYIKLESRDYAKAVEHLKQADMTDPFHKLLLARAYEKLGDQENAQKLYKEIAGFNQVTMERALSYTEAKKKLKG